MTTRTASDRLEEVVEQFELRWTESSRDQIPSMLAQAALNADAEAAVELVRIDIQRRYAVELPVDLAPYFELIKLLSSKPDLLIAVAYEDFRTRQAHTLHCARERWSSVPGVDGTSWYNSLFNDKVLLLSKQHESKASVQQTVDKPPMVPVLARSSAEIAIRSVGFVPIKQIGQGAFSRVFLARQESLANRYVVIKAAQRVFDEADRLAELQHTNIVPIYSLHQCGPWSLLCMPYAGLVTLADYFNAVPDSRLRGGQSFVSTIQQSQGVTLRQPDGNEALDRQQVRQDLPAPTLADSLTDEITPLRREALILWLFSRMADALHHAHARGIIHGDIKPANLLIRNDGEPALLDFNLSRKLDAEPAAIGGTLPYMSPESMQVLMGSKIPISPTSDLYSLGAVLYQFLTGRLAYPSPRSAAAIDLELAIAERQESVKWEVSDQVSPSLRAIVEKCLAASMSHRYASADQLRDDLECERHNLPLKYTRERSIRHRARKWIARHPRLTSAASVTAAASIIIFMMSLILWRITESRETLAAAQNFRRFETDAKVSLADLLIVNRDTHTHAIANAESALETYRVLSDARWQSDPGWKRVSESDQQAALSLMTHLLLKIAWHGLHDASTVHSDLADSNSRSGDLVDRALDRLATEPFKSFAPITIDYIRQSMRRPDASAWLPSTMASEATRSRDMSALDRLGLATKYIEQGNGEAAVDLLPVTLLRQIDPYTYWVTLGRAQMAICDLRAAELSFSMAIETYRLSPTAFHYRGVCRMTMRSVNDARKAIEDFSSALARQPDSVESLMNRSMAREFTGDLAEAMSDVKKLLYRDPENVRALIIQSRLYRKLDEPELAKQALERAFQTPPKEISGWISVALARLPSDIEGALRDLLHAQKLSPSSIEVLQNLAHIYSEHLDQPEQAIEALDRLLSINPAFEPALLGRGVLKARAGQTDAALEDLRTATQASTRLTPASLYQAACIYAQLLPHSENDDRINHWKRDAFAYLSTALQQGYGADIIESDPDLSPLASDARFVSILSTVHSARALRDVQR